MDVDDFEDMLFGAPCSQDLPAQNLIEDSDDDILFPLIEDEPILWDLPNSQLPTPPTTKLETVGHVATDITEYSREQAQHRPTDHARRPVHDRYFNGLCTRLNIANPSTGTG